jgi:hypothetical protein
MGTSSNRIDISGSNSQKTLNNPTEIKKTSTINELLCVNKGVDITNDVDTIFAKNTKNRSLVLSQNNTKPIFLKKALPIIKTEITKTDPMNISLLASASLSNNFKPQNVYLPSRTHTLCVRCFILSINLGTESKSATAILAAGFNILLPFLSG